MTAVQISHEQWLKARQTGIGGSDVAPILGISKWTTPLDVYNEKVADTPTEKDSDPMEWGRRLEPVIRQAYADKTGRVVAVPEKQFRSGAHPFMIANVDGVCEDRLLEIKTARSGADWGEEGTNEIPDYYLTQVMHYMIVTGYRLCDVAVLIGASDFRIYTVEYDDDLAQLLIEAEAKFWKMVENRTPPAPRSLAETKAAFPASVPSSIEADNKIAEAMTELAKVRNEIKQLKDTDDKLTAVVQAFMGESEKLTFEGSTLATWKSSKPVARLDSAALKKAMPDIYDQYTKQSAPTRRFIVKITEE